MKFKTLQIAKHDDPGLPGYEARTLLVDGVVDKYGYFKSGTVIAQFFASSVGEAEEYAEKFLELYKESLKEDK